MNGVDLIKLARELQLDKGYTHEHDQEHCNGELVEASLSYSHLVRSQLKSGQLSDPHTSRIMAQYWPWSEDSWSPSNDVIKNLAKAGALIAAEIDRLLAAKDD